MPKRNDPPLVRVPTEEEHRAGAPLETVDLEPALTDEECEALAEQQRIEDELELDRINAKAKRLYEASFEAEWCDGFTTTTGTQPAPADPTVVYRGVEGEFELRNDGVFQNFYYEEDGHTEKNSEFLCSPLKVAARCRAQDGHAWGYVLHWRDPDGREHSWSAPADILASIDTDLVRILSLRGMLISGGTNQAIKAYIRTVNPERRMLSVSRAGWFSDTHGRVFVLPNQVVGSRTTGDKILFQTDLQASDFHVRAAGNLQQWKDYVAKYCVGNHLLVFAASVAFAAPTLEVLHEDSAGFHLYGRSSKGKTTTLHIARSVWGYPKQSWRTTDNALESLAECHNNVLLPLDELRELDPRKIEPVVYMLSDGMGKARSTIEKTLVHQPRKTWSLLFLSTGEVTPAELAAKAAVKIKAGVEVRMVNLPAIISEEFGLFEDIHGMVDAEGRPNPEAFSKLLQRNTEQYCGVAGPAWVKWFTENEAQAVQRLREMIEAFMNNRKIVPAGASGEILRVARRFAVVGAAGELATEAGVTGWAGGTAIDAASWCFQRWCSGRSMGSSDLERAVEEVRAFLMTNASRFQDLDSSYVVHHRAGFVRTKRAANDFDKAVAPVEEWYILTKVFKSELCHEQDSTAVAQELHRRGYLRRDKKHLTVLQRVPGHANPIRVYAVQSAILSEEEPESL